MTALDPLADLTPSHLRVCDQAFATLTCSPAPWSLDCTTVDGVPGAQLGLPQGPVPLPRLRDWMLAHRDNYTARDAIWRELITRARTLGGDWRIAAVGMAMPALVRFARGLARDYHGDPADLDNEILTAFLEVDCGSAPRWSVQAGCRQGRSSGRRRRLRHRPVRVSNSPTLLAGGPPGRKMLRHTGRYPHGPGTSTQWRGRSLVAVAASRVRLWCCAAAHRRYGLSGAVIGWSPPHGGGAHLASAVTKHHPQWA